MLTIEKASYETDYNSARALLREYAELRGHDPALGDFQSELETLPKRYGEPEGALLLARWEGRAAGCVAIRSLGTGVCEMKRLFVAPGFQGRGIGKELVGAILEIARRKGYTHMRLDSHPWMTRAQYLYDAFGFRQIEPYNDNPTPGIRFFERALRG